MKKYLYIVLLSLAAQISCAEHHEMGEVLGTWEFELVSNTYSFTCAVISFTTIYRQNCVCSFSCTCYRQFTSVCICKYKY